MTPHRLGWMLALAAGCVEVSSARRAPLEGCRFTDECRVPLICAADRCRVACRTDRDCTGGWRCLSAGVTDRYVCYAPDDYANACVFDSHCRGGRICGGDRVCRSQCASDYDCAVIAPGLSCLSSGVCSSHPFLSDSGALRDVDLNLRDASAPPADAFSEVDVVGVDAAGADAPDADPWPACAERSGGCRPGVDMGCRVSAVAVHGSSCALISDGTVRCWGAGPTRGTGSSEICLVPGIVPGLAGATGLAIGSDFACARRTGDASPIWCWGSNAWGQLGRGGPQTSTPMRAGPTISLPDGEVTLSDTAGGFVVPNNGSYWAFGWNVHATFGNGRIDTLVDRTMPPPSVPVEVMFPGVVEVGGGQVHGCLRTADGRAGCWGRGDTGQLGSGRPESDAITSPRMLPTVTDAQALGVGSYHACVLRADRSVQCWGSSLSGQLARGAPMMASAPVALAGINDCEALFVGSASTCVRRAGGAMWCTGLGLPGRSTALHTMTHITALDGARSVSIFDTRGCAVGGDEVLRCWGNTPGVLGVTQSPDPAAVTF